MTRCIFMLSTPRERPLRADGGEMMIARGGITLPPPLRHVADCDDITGGRSGATPGAGRPQVSGRCQDEHLGHRLAQDRQGGGIP